VAIGIADEFPPKLDAIVTYDRGLTDGALLLGFHVEAPAGT